MDRHRELMKRFTCRYRDRDPPPENSTIEQIFAYFRYISLRPVPVQISLGTGGGFFIGYFFTKISKFLAAATGISLILIQFFNYRGYIKFRPSLVPDDFYYINQRISHSYPRGASQLTFRMRQINDFAYNNAYLIGGFTAGSLLGYGIA